MVLIGLFSFLVLLQQAEGLTCTSTPADILFMLGTSNGDGSSFDIQLEFVKNFSKAFDIGPDSVQVAVATYANTTKPGFWFSDYSNKDDVLAAIDKLKYQSGETLTEKALKYVREEGFRPEHGVRNDSRRILILMTNGQSPEKSETALQAQAIHNSGIYVIAIGIGTNIDQTELKDIASGTGDKNFFAVSNFDVLHTIELPIEKQTCELCSTRPADVVFLLDTSNSEGENNFYKQLNFVSNFASRLIIGPDNVQISVVTFSSSTKMEFSLDQYHQKQDLLDAIANVIYRPGDTQTDDGLHFVVENSFLAKNGARHNANQVVIVVTDGQSTQKTSTAAQAVVLHERGIKVISVGVGVNIDNQELRDIASGEKFVFTVDDFDALVKIEQNIVEITCKAKVSECSTEPREIIFLLDSSTSEGSANFKKQLDFVNSFVDGFDIGPNAVQVGVVTFSTSTVNRFNLDAFNSKAALQAAITRIPYSAGQTHTGTALEFVRKVALSPANGARGDSKKVIIVMTDGQSQQKVLTANQGILLRKQGVKVISVGIGLNVNRAELAVIASDDKHMFKVNSFDDLATVEPKVQARVCSKLVCASTPADIMFILDTSASIGPVNFKEMLEFVINFVRKFDVGTSAVQFGVVTFSSDVYPQFDLDRYSDKEQVIAAISTITYQYGGTSTQKALDYVRDVSFTAAHGSRNEASHIAVVLTDGQSESSMQTNVAAEKLYNNGVEVISVGIGSAVDPDELTSIATNVSYVFSVATFNALETIQNELLLATCSAQASLTVTKKPGVCEDGNQADVIFILDSSNSEGSAHFQDELRFVEQIVNDFTVGPDDYQFGIITFGSRARIWFNLNDTSTLSQLRLDILQVAYQGGLTYTDQALELARTEGFTEEKGARNGVSQIAIVVTDGSSTQRTWTLLESDRVKRAGIHIIAVGVGDKVDSDELSLVATAPSDSILATSFDDLSNHVKEVQRKLCTQTMTTSAVSESTATVENSPLAAETSPTGPSLTSIPVVFG